MNAEAIEDLKQFIAATVYQEMSVVNENIVRLVNKVDNLDLRLTGKIDSLDHRVSNLDVRLTNQIRDLSDSVADAIENSNQTTGVQLNNHEVRITKLEHKTAN